MRLHITVFRMTEVFIPIEVKKLIYEYLDLDSFKNLRQVSSSWAQAGFGFLLFPTFNIKSYFVDINRLVGIGRSPELSQQAASIVKTIAVRSIDWDPSYFREIVCNRPRPQNNFEISNIESTRQKDEALKELNAMIEQRQMKELHAVDIYGLAQGLRQVPGADTIRIDCPNIFKHIILREAWSEYELQTYGSTRFEKGAS
ncbi:hypothetical protein EG329_012367 [Mollisiaceae sp. DMI_Dod_QoI]|nr:hypothetical protein EG329_012367 [Helotiales sp. DMI_Dod_QoI]